MSRRLSTAVLAVLVPAILLGTGAAAGKSAGSASAPGQQPPVNVAPPSISGSMKVGAVLSADPGSWDGVNVSYAYQWLRCDSGGGGCSAIGGATGSGLSEDSGVVGATLRLAVTATNKNGSALATSGATGVVAGAQTAAQTTTSTPATPTTTTTPTTATTTHTTTTTPTTTTSPATTTTPTTTTTPPTTTTAPPTTTTTQASYSSSRYVWCLGTPTWAYASTPGWAFAINGYNGLSSTGWSRDSAGESSLTPVRLYFDDSVPLMSSVSGTYGQPGTSGPCHTVAVRIDPSDPQVPGITAGAQASVLRMDQGQDTNPFWGTRPTTNPHQGETWWYGYAAATNAAYVPYGGVNTDLGFGNWNSFGLDFHSSIGLLGPVMPEIATTGPAAGTAGPNGSVVYPCNSTMVKLAQPRIEIALTAGLNNATVNDANHTCLRFQGPVFHAGTQYKEIYQVKWDAFGQGLLRWWVDSGDGRGYVLYADVSGVSTLWRDASNNVDAHTYPQFLNYRKADSSLPSSVMYYGGMIRGTAMSDVTIP